VFKEDLFKGKKILITGGGTGLGRAMAERLLGLGAEIAICGRRKGVCDAAAAELMKAHGGVVRSYRVDIRDAAAVEAMVEEIFREGALTSLVNNAAGNFIARTEDLSPRGFDAIANIVMHGTFYVTQAVGKRWIASGSPGVGDEQGGGAGDDHVARERMGPVRRSAQRDRPRGNPDRRREQKACAGREVREGDAKRQSVRARRPHRRIAESRRLPSLRRLRVA